jgi:hypothetical protein
MYAYSENVNCSVKKPSTKFNLEGLRNKDDYEIKRTAKKYQYLSQPQRDLIRHQAPSAYTAILELAKATKDSQETAFKAQAHLSKSAMDVVGNSYLNSMLTKDARTDMFNAIDRMHERTTRSIEYQNSDNNSTSRAMTATVTTGVVLVALGWAIFGGGRK